MSDQCEPLLCQASSQIQGDSDERNIVLGIGCPMWAEGRGNRAPGRGRGVSTGPSVHTNVRLGIKGSGSPLE